MKALKAEEACGRTDDSCSEVLKNYFRVSYLYDVFRRLPTPIRPIQFPRLAKSLCHSYIAVFAHVHCRRETVKVLTEYRKETVLNISQILEAENEIYLISVRDMEYINIFLQAIGEAPFPFLKFVSRFWYNREFAVPQVRRNSSDRINCLAHFVNPVYEIRTTPDPFDCDSHILS